MIIILHLTADYNNDVRSSSATPHPSPFNRHEPLRYNGQQPTSRSVRISNWHPTTNVFHGKGKKKPVPSWGLACDWISILLLFKTAWSRTSPEGWGVSLLFPHASAPAPDQTVGEVLEEGKGVRGVNGERNPTVFLLLFSKRQH